MFLGALDSKSFTPAICLVPILHSWFLGLESLSYNAGVNGDRLFNTDANLSVSSSITFFAFSDSASLNGGQLGVSLVTLNALF
jgi:hypothetical protein